MLKRSLAHSRTLVRYKRDICAFCIVSSAGGLTFWNDILDRIHNDLTVNAETEIFRKSPGWPWVAAPNVAVNRARSHDNMFEGLLIVYWPCPPLEVWPRSWRNIIGKLPWGMEQYKSKSQAAEKGFLSTANWQYLCVLVEPCFLTSQQLRQQLIVENLLIFQTALGPFKNIMNCLLLFSVAHAIAYKCPFNPDQRRYSSRGDQISTTSTGVLRNAACALVVTAVLKYAAQIYAYMRDARQVKLT